MKTVLALTAILTLTGCATNFSGPLQVRQVLECTTIMHDRTGAYLTEAAEVCTTVFEMRRARKEAK